MTACDYCEIDYVEEGDLFLYASGKKMCKIHSNGYRQKLGLPILNQRGLEN